MATWQFYSMWDDLIRPNTGNKMAVEKERETPLRKKTSERKSDALVLGDLTEAADARRGLRRTSGIAKPALGSKNIQGRETDI